MKNVAGLAIVVAASCFAGQVLADTNIAQGKAVTLFGTFGTDPGSWTSASPVPAATLTDGVFLNEGHQWDLDSVWWNGYTHPENDAQINLGGLYTINSFKVQADDNDTYRIQYRVGGGAWQTAWNIPAPGPWGLVTSTTTLGAPVLADSLRFTATGGDGYYAVSEIQAFGVAAVPEPETYAMLLAGLGFLGFVARRRKQQTA